MDVPLTAAHLRYFAGWPTHISGEVLPVAQPNMHCYTRKEPVGVAAQIIPWNFPLADGGLEGRAGAGRRLHDRAQARRADAAHGAAVRRAGARGRHPRGRAERGRGRRRDGRRAGGPRRGGQDRVHGLDRRGPRDRREGGPRAQAGDARARRQVAQHHPAGRRPRRCREGRVPGDLLQHRPGLQRRLAPVRAQGPVRRGDVRACRGGRQGAARAGARREHPDGPAHLRRAGGAGARLHRVGQVRGRRARHRRRPPATATGGSWSPRSSARRTTT